MLSHPLRLDEDRILKEQLRLVLGNVASALIPTLALSTLLVWALSPPGELTTLLAWWAGMMSLKTYVYFHARRHLASDLSLTSPHRLVWTLILLNALDGGLWGALAWATLSTSTVAGSILVITTAAGMLGSGLSRLSPIMPVFFAFVVTLLSLLAGKIWSLGDPSYRALGIVCLIYLVSLSLMARNGARTIRAAINLRFENEELLLQLRAKTEIALAAQREAEQANAAKSKFLAAASHDLRQPVHAQGLFLDVLSRTDLSARQRELLNNAKMATSASSEMLGALLDFSRIEAGVVKPVLQPLRLMPVLQKIEVELAPQAEAQGIVYRTRATPLIVQSDPILLDLVLRNLVTNAIRYTAHGGVLVACRRRGSQAVLEVWDTGIGVAPQHQQDVFREFHQLGNPERDRRKGLGLGLAIAKGMALAMGHDLTLSSAEGRGSVFRLAMPVADAVVESDSLVLGSNAIRPISAYVLVIDDDESIRAAMLPLLREWGCECEAAESVEAAIELAQARAPDLIISDYRLREQRTGLQAITAVRRVCDASLPALLITGDTSPERLREAQATGLPLMHKPVAPDQLYRRIRQLLAERT
jgi:two-component system, sensor histidine kinase